MDPKHAIFEPKSETGKTYPLCIHRGPNLSPGPRMCILAQKSGPKFLNSFSRVHWDLSQIYARRAEEVNAPSFLSRNSACGYMCVTFCSICLQENKSTCDGMFNNDLAVETDEDFAHVIVNSWEKSEY